MVVGHDNGKSLPFRVIHGIHGRDAVIHRDDQPRPGLSGREVHHIPAHPVPLAAFRQQVSHIGKPVYCKGRVKDCRRADPVTVVIPEDPYGTVLKTFHQALDVPQDRYPVFPPRTVFIPLVDD